jgi:spore cortex biosynthesis protein YabQ
VDPLQRLDSQFYALFMVILCGAVLGLLFDLLRVVRGYYRPAWILSAISDLLFWTVATVALSGALFFGNWGEFRLYVLIGLLAGIGLYYWLAGALIRRCAWQVLQILEWLANLMVMIIIRLIWAPLMVFASLLSATLLLLWRWFRWCTIGAWQALISVGNWLFAPLVGPCRCAKLQYLLFKRRVKRRLRHFLFGPPKSF